MERIIWLIIVTIILSAITTTRAQEEQKNRINVASHRSMLRVIDGDSLIYQGERFRLIGIDAPEYAQTCQYEGRIYPCGKDAKNYLESMIMGSSISCEGDKRDRYKRRLVICYINDKDVNALMVEGGYALSYHRDDRYLTHQGEAQMQKRGVWRGDFIQPHRWRRGDRLL